MGRPKVAPQVPQICEEDTCRKPFIPTPHSSGQRFCSERCHSRWRYWAFRANRAPTGYFGRSSLTADQIGDVLEAFYGTDEPLHQLAARFDVHTHVISRIAREGRPRLLAPKHCANPLCGKAFVWQRQKKFCSVPCERKFNWARQDERRRALRGPYRSRQPLLDRNDLADARRLLAKGMSKTKVAAQFGVSARTLRRYLNPKQPPKQGPFVPPDAEVDEAVKRAIARRLRYQQTGVWANAG